MTATSTYHRASLVSPSSHSSELLAFLAKKTSRRIIDALVEAVVETVDVAMDRPSTLHHLRRSRNSCSGSTSSSSSPFRSSPPASSSSSSTASISSFESGSLEEEYARFTAFTSTLLSRADLQPSVITVAIIYIARIRPHLQISIPTYAPERVLVGALVSAAKYLNDSTLRNRDWAKCTGVFGKRDVGRMEREFLGVLEWELSVCERDVEVLSHILSNYSSSSSSSSSIGVGGSSSSRGSISSSGSSEDSDGDSVLSLFIGATAHQLPSPSLLSSSSDEDEDEEEEEHIAFRPPLPRTHRQQHQLHVKFATEPAAAAAVSSALPPPPHRHSRSIRSISSISPPGLSMTSSPASSSSSSSAGPSSPEDSTSPPPPPPASAGAGGPHKRPHPYAHPTKFSLLLHGPEQPTPMKCPRAH